MQQVRRESIKDMLRSIGFVNVQELVNRFGVSSETIRRDLEAMEKDGLVRRIHGGAVSTQPVVSESAYTLRRQFHTPEKQAIAHAAANLICDGDTVLIAPGTTTLEIASQLRKRANLTVITNSLPITMELADCAGINVFCLGGHLQGADFSTSGITAMQNLSLFNATKLIIGIGGITPQRGITDYRMEESVLLRAFVEKSDCVIGIADHSKFGVTAMYNICPADRLNHLITDSGTPEDLYKPFCDMGVQVHVAQADMPAL
ncbi:DeoR/GlpR family DNA-binding transcription regulator [Hominifimenecus sp. rT4P-3]|uniref:DeoR/GlpR family DNA-binding transcription regulator n=1 Tax=Hominifimenecus sp. rT4P-3 TaxID=3242979 RepID=UPI003DA59F09